MSPPFKSASTRLTRTERETLVLDVAADLFYARGVHEVGMDELIGATGLGKATVYRLFATKDILIGAYLQRLADEIFTLIDAHAGEESVHPGAALSAVIDAVEADVRRPGFRGCPFNNASIEYQDPEHPARQQARRYRQGLLQRLTSSAGRLSTTNGVALAQQLAVLIDGIYTNAAHLGAAGPAEDGLRLARQLVIDGGGPP